MGKIQINMKQGSVVHDEDIIIGIDLGTTNSLVAYMENGQAVTIKTSDQRSALVPSILSIIDSKVLVGEEAKARLVTNPSETVYSVKRLMGKSLNDVTLQKSFLSYDLKLDDPDALVRIKIGEQYYTPIELSAQILKQLKLMAEDHLKKMSPRRSSPSQLILMMPRDRPPGMPASSPDSMCCVSSTNLPLPVWLMDWA